MRILAKMVKWIDVINEAKLIPIGINLNFELVDQNKHLTKLLTELKLDQNSNVLSVVETKFPRPYNSIDNRLAAYNIDSFMIDKNIAAYFSNFNKQWVFLDIHDVISSKKDANKLIMLSKLYL